MFSKMALIKKLIVLALVAFGTSPSSAQVALDGDSKVNSGDFVRIKVTKAEGKDLKIVCVPENNNWEAVKNINDQILVLFSPKKTDYDTTYYFFAAITNAEKTYTAVLPVIVLGVKGPDPTPVPGPTPKPVPTIPQSELSKRFDTYYMVSPNKAQLGNYIEVFSGLASNVDSDKFSNYGQAMTVLVASTKDKLKSDTDLRALRDEVAHYLIENTGRDSTKYDKAKLSSSLAALISALKEIERNR